MPVTVASSANSASDGIEYSVPVTPSTGPYVIGNLRTSNARPNDRSRPMPTASPVR